MSAALSSPRVFHDFDQVRRAGEIAVFTLPTVNLRAEWLETRLSLLDAVERRRAYRLAPEHGRRDYIAAHALIRHVLAQVLHCSPAEVRFARRGLGEKPKLLEPAASELDFNLSHGRDLVACVVSGAGPVGIGVEAVAPSFSPADLSYVLAPIEAAWIAQQTDQPRAFLRVWTLKEALTKATGTGLPLDLDKLAVRPGLMHPLVTHNELGVASNWRLHQWQAPHHVAALAHYCSTADEAAEPVVANWDGHCRFTSSGIPMVAATSRESEGASCPLFEGS